jgi:hypothetical protein
LQFSANFEQVHFEQVQIDKDRRSSPISKGSVNRNSQGSIRIEAHQNYILQPLEKIAAPRPATTCQVLNRGGFFQATDFTKIGLETKDGIECEHYTFQSVQAGLS